MAPPRSVPRGATNFSLLLGRKGAWMRDREPWFEACAPAFLRVAELIDHAETLGGLAALTGTREAKVAQPSLRAARAAARATARATARDALAPTVTQLQVSALLLVDRMIAVTAGPTSEEGQ